MTEERRTCRRYPLTLDLRYQIKKRKLTVAQGSGTTCDMSARSIAFTGSLPLPLQETTAEVSVDWPIPLDSSPLKLVASGRVIRTDTTRIVVLITRYDFRLRGA